jgi:hypothetical protein
VSVEGCLRDTGAVDQLVDPYPADTAVREQVVGGIENALPGVQYRATAGFDTRNHSQDYIRLTDRSVSDRKTALSTDVTQPEQQLVDYGRRMLLREVNIDFDFVTGTYELVCECERHDCLKTIEVPFAAYEEARNDGRVFLLGRGMKAKTVMTSVAGFTSVSPRTRASSTNARQCPNPLTFMKGSHDHV